MYCDQESTGTHFYYSPGSPISIIPLSLSKVRQDFRYFLISNFLG